MVDASIAPAFSISKLSTYFPTVLPVGANLVVQMAWTDAASYRQPRRHRPGDRVKTNRQDAMQ